MSGSLRYMAPEVANCEPYDQSVDVYSFGILMYQVLTGITPFLGCKREKFMLDVVQNNMRPIVAPVEALAADRRCCRETSDKLIGMMRRCWDPNRISRPTMLIVYEELVAMHASELAMKDAGGCCVPAV
ncbi:STY8 [Symbiodinium microadriaticum]|nr:STY8 [Symbiodinium microadriaticum]